MNTYIKQPIFSAAPYFYPISKQVGYTVRYIIRMNEEIDGDALKKAFETAMQRYPYLKLKLVKGIYQDHLEYNDAPLVVLNTSEALELGSQTNGHLIALTYKRRSIYINNSHGLVDGRGRGPFMKTLLYYYCKFKYDEDVEMEGVNLADSPIDPAEYEDPFMRPIPKRKLIFYSRAKIKALQLRDMGLVKVSEPMVYCLQIGEATFMKWCKEHDATPNVAISVLLQRAIKKLHPDTKQKIASTITCDLRTTLNAPKSHWSMVDIVQLTYDKRMDNLPINDQCTIYRGQLLLQSDPDVFYLGTLIRQIEFRALYLLPKFLKKIVCRMSLRGIDLKGTFNLSYTGKVSYGTCDKHIRGLFSEPNFGSDFACEVTVAKGQFILDIHQNWKEPVYVDALISEFEANGIHAEKTYVYDQRCTLMEV